jgi:chromosome segregation ATPase
MSKKKARKRKGKVQKPAPNGNGAPGRTTVVSPEKAAASLNRSAAGRSNALENDMAKAARAYFANMEDDHLVRFFEERKTMQGRIEELEKTINLHKEGVDKAVKQGVARKLASAVSEARAEGEEAAELRLNPKLERAKSSLATVRKNLKAANEERDSLKDKLTELAPKLLELEELGQLREAHETLTENLTASQQEATKASSDLITARQQVQRCRAAKNQATTARDEALARIKDLEMDAAQVEDSTAVRSENTKLKSDLSTANRKVREKENELAQATSNLERETKRVSKMTTAFNGRKAAMKAQARDLKLLKEAAKR